jgi:hypothetical protein
LPDLTLGDHMFESLSRWIEGGSMFERFKNNGSSADEPGARTGSVATREPADGTVADGTTATRVERPVGPTGNTMQRVRARQREEYGGINWGAAFFGWLVAVGVAVLLTGILAAAGAAIGLTQPSTANQAVNSSTTTLSLAGAIALLVVLAIAYYCGGYVAGRMARFSGLRQGLAVWLWGIIVAIILGLVGAVAGTQANVISQLGSVPNLPFSPSTITLAGVVSAVLALVVMLVGALLGGLAGMRYHRRVDRVGLEG